MPSAELAQGNGLSQSQSELAVYDSRTFAGSVIPDGNNQWSAITAAGQWLGLHTTWRGAADAVWREHKMEAPAL